jgi:hypothetical protein
MNIDETLFPHVRVHFKNNTNLTKNGVSTYLNYWNLKQCEKQEFSCCIDTTAMHNYSLYTSTKHAITIAKFIKKMKKEPVQYLKYTILVMTNSILIQLLDMILKLTTPCATIYIVDSMNKANALFNTLHRNNILEINAYLLIQEIKYISPN